MGLALAAVARKLLVMKMGFVRNACGVWRGLRAQVDLPVKVQRLFFAADAEEMDLN